MPCTHDQIEPGDRFRFNAINWSLISAKTLPPVWRYLTVVAVGKHSVWYRFDDEGVTKQTGVRRWDEVAQAVFHHSEYDLQRID